jgi:hypothetical protein
MMNEEHCQIASIGLRAKTARAIVVVVSGTGRLPHAVLRKEITLATPDSPAIFQPYHQVMDLSWDRAVLAVRDSEQAIVTLATNGLKALLLDLHTRDLNAVSAAVVGAPDRELQAIGSPHIRAHAAEGVLFRRVWQIAAEAVGIPSTAFPQKGFEAFAANRLGLSIDALRERLADLGHAVGRPWRADEKAAAIAAWLARSS